jgi:hypothetical protein
MAGLLTPVRGLFNSVADFTSRVDDDTLAALLTRMALTSLVARDPVT